MKKIYTFVTMLVAVVLLTACGGRDQEILVVATSADFPPFEFIDDAGNYVGFDMDLIRALADEMDVEIRIDNMDFGGIIMAIYTGEADIAIAAMTIDEERAQSVLFTNYYFETTQVVLVQRYSDIVTIGQIPTYANIGVQMGTTSAMIVTDFGALGGDVNAVMLNQAPLVVMELVLGRVDAVVIDYAVAQLFLAEHDGLRMLDEVLAIEQYAIAVNMGQPELVTRLNTALAALRADGRFQEIYDYWFGGYDD